MLYGGYKRVLKSGAIQMRVHLIYKSNMAELFFFKEYYQLFCKWMSLQKPIFPKVTSCFGRSFFFFISCCSWIRDIYGLGWLWSRAYIQYLLTYMYGISYHLYPFLLLSNIDSLIWSFSYKTWESEIFFSAPTWVSIHAWLSAETKVLSAWKNKS